MSTQEQCRLQDFPRGVRCPEINGQEIRESALLPWRGFPKSHAHMLALGRDRSLAHKRRRGERPVTLYVLIEWLIICRRLGLSVIARDSLAPLAAINGHGLVPLADIQHGSVAREISDVSRATGEALAVFADAMDDAELDADEAEILLASFLCVRDELDEVIAALREVVE